MANGVDHHDTSDDGQVTYTSIISVERSLAILEELTKSPAGLTVTELSNLIRINKAMIHRILATMVEQGFVYKETLTQRYKVTSKLLALAFGYLRHLNIYDVVLPVLSNLADKTGELAELNWMHLGRLTIVAKVESPRRVKVVDYLGEDQPVHASASGKAWLASLPVDEALRIAVERGMPQYTHNTITTIQQLQAELETIRERGYAVNNCEGSDEVVAVAAPVIPQNRDERAVGAVSVVSPAYRQVHRNEEVIELTIGAAAEIGNIWPFVSLER